MASEKDRIRRLVWDRLLEKGVALFPLPPHGRIPNFKGADKAALKLLEIEAWRKATIVKVNPDSPQKWVRLLALKHGKKIIMATPRMRQGFILIDPSKLPPYLYEQASTIRGAFRYGRLLGLDELRDIGHIDFIVTGSVAADLKGRRLGKGEGYAELEYAVLRELGLASEDTPIATTVHELQIVETIPRDPYDVTLDYIATPERLIVVKDREPRPPGILWDKLPCRKLEEIPLLRDLARLKGVKVVCRNSS